MAVTIENLNEEAARTLHDLCESVFLKGECYAFAIALHQGLGWPIIGLMDGNTVHHALVSNPEDEMLFDARGPVTPERAGKPFGFTHPYELRPVKEQDLHKIRPIGERSIARAMQMAEVLWPGLPWKDSLREHVRNFAEELEELSRRYGVWIRAFVPADPPILDISYDDEETGYILRPTYSGTTFAIDRTFS